jgi:sugar lactone lactonase YvrE
VSSIPEQGLGPLFDGPSGVAVDAAGNMYVADGANHRIRKLTTAGVLTTLAGDGTPGFMDGPGATARFNSPADVAIDAAGNVYVTDGGNQRVRKITPAGVVSTLAGDGTTGFADGPGATARFNVPLGVAVDAAGNVYVGEEMNDRIRKITPAGVVSTLAGSGTRGFVDGPGAVAQFSSPEGVAVDRSGNVYVADENNHRIRKITPAGVVSTLAGDGTLAFANGTGAAARFASPQRVAVDAAGNVYVIDGALPRVRKVTPAGVVTTLAGDGTAGLSISGGPSATARFNDLRGLAVDAAGNVYVADAGNHRIRKIAPAGTVSTLAGLSKGHADGPVKVLPFNDPEGVAVDAAGNLYVADSGSQRIQKVSPGGVITTLAGDGTAGFADGPGTTARFSAPEAVAVDTAGNLYVADENNHRIRRITPAGDVSTLAGDGTAGFADGPGATARFNVPNGVAVDGAGNVYVGDTRNYRVRKITPTGVVSTVAGDGTAGMADGPGATARFNAPGRVGVDAAGNVYVGDGANHRIRKITPAGVVSTLAGDGTAGFVDGPGATARFNGPQSVAVDAAGNVYVADELNHRIRMITPAGIVSTLAGDGTAGFVNGPGSTARFVGPQGVAVDAAGNVFVTDDGNNVLRRIR